jgi:hypothetical protein
MRFTRVLTVDQRRAMSWLRQALSDQVQRVVFRGVSRVNAWRDEPPKDLPKPWL